MTKRKHNANRIAPIRRLIPGASRLTRLFSKGCHALSILLPTNPVVADQIQRLQRRIKLLCILIYAVLIHNPSACSVQIERRFIGKIIVISIRAESQRIHQHRTQTIS